MSGSINFSGLGSGIDTNSIVDQLLAVDRQPEQFWKDDQARLTQRQTAYSSVSAAVLGVQSAAFNVDALRSFDLVTATSSDTTATTVTAQTGAQVGTHTLVVSQLAKAQTISTAPQISQTAPLGFTGQILINGKSINVQTADSLQSLAGNINASQTGVTASIISPVAGQYYLTLSSNGTGVQNTISLADVGAGNLLGGTLGVFAGASSSKNILAGGIVGSNLFSDSATSIGTLQGQTAPAAGTVSITAGGVTKSVALDLSQNLSAAAASINTAFGSTVAQIVAVTDPVSKTTKQQLQITGATAFTDSNNVLADLGLYTKDLGAGRELAQAKDASFTFDGIAASRASNSFSDAITGVTINLLKDAGTTSTFTISQDTTTIKDNIHALVSAFNNAINTIASLSQYDSNSGKTGPLFGDVTTQSITDLLVSNATGPIAGLPSSLSVLSQIGITLDTSDHLSVDDGALSAQLTSNLQGVAKLFRAYGTTTNPTVQFVTSGTNTKPSPPVGYAIAVTQPATAGVVLGSVAQTVGLASTEVLTFGGSLFGTGTTGTLTGRSITIQAGSLASDVVSQINADSVIGAQIAASLDGAGKLQLTAKKYGSQATFAVVSSVPAGTTSTGIGQTIQVQSGLDVIGTINGETATGNGQFLLGSQQIGSVKGSAYGLQVRVTATTPGSYGNVVFTSGTADLLRNYGNTQTDVYVGTLTTAVSGLGTNIKDLQASIDDLEARVVDEGMNLRARFTAMEVAVSRIKASTASVASLSYNPYTATTIATK